jgi:hypothetical protein
MSDAKKCDRCGDFFVMAPTVQFGTISSNTIKINKNGCRSSARIGKFDLCRRCDEAFTNFMSNISNEVKENAED